MKQYMSEGEAMYMDKNFGLFSKRLAQWAIDNMEVEDPATHTMKPLKAKTLEEVQEILKANKVDIQEEFIYTAWYLFNMALADYPKTCKTDEQRASFVDETICDPDGMPENVLSCFVAKMCNAQIPIHWEKYL
jgi:hypothetical protein